MTITLALSGCSETSNHPILTTTKKNPQSQQQTFAAIAIPDQYGAQISQDILNQGGNAIDAARIFLGCNLYRRR